MTVILTMIIERPAEIKRLKGKHWMLIYGRRKTGKTFLVENYLKYDEMFFVNRDGSILDKSTWESMGYDSFRRLLRAYLDSGKTVVVDEFHRLGSGFTDMVHALPQSGRLVLVSSTLHTAGTMMNSGSPLLGKLSEMKVPLISLGDSLLALEGREKDPKKMLEKAVMMREPILIKMMEGREIYEVVESFSMTVSALTGEVFSEEDRKMTRRYEAVIRAVASGKSGSGEISSFLYSRGLLSKEDPSLVQQYMNNLVDMGILRKLPVWGRRRTVYEHVSPLSWLFYSMDERYGIGERTVSPRESEAYVRELMPHIVEAEVREFMSHLFDMRAYIHQDPDCETDGIFVRFKRPDFVLEVKWKENPDSKDVLKMEKKTEKLGLKGIMVVPNKAGLKSDIVEIMDIGDLMKIYRKKLL